MPALSGHFYVDTATDCHELRRQVEALLHERYAITHTTLQTDHVNGDSANESAVCAFDSHER